MAIKDYAYFQKASSVHVDGAWSRGESPKKTSARVDGSGLEVIWSGYRCTELHIWTPAIGLLPLSLQGLAGNRPAEPAWQPRVGARKRFLRVRAKHSPIQSPTLRDCGACNWALRRLSLS